MQSVNLPDLSPETLPDVGRSASVPASPLPGDVTVFYDEHVTWITLAGDVDIAMALELQRAGSAALEQGAPLRVSVHHVRFLDSTAIGFLARLAAAQATLGRRLTIEGARGRVLDALRLAHLELLLDLEN